MVLVICVIINWNIKCETSCTHYVIVEKVENLLSTLCSTLHHLKLLLSLKIFQRYLTRCFNLWWQYFKDSFLIYHYHLIIFYFFYFVILYFRLLLHIFFLSTSYLFMKTKKEQLQLLATRDASLQQGSFCSSSISKFRDGYLRVFHSFTLSGNCLNM